MKAVILIQVSNITSLKPAIISECRTGFTIVIVVTPEDNISPEFQFTFLGDPHLDPRDTFTEAGELVLVEYIVLWAIDGIVDGAGASLGHSKPWANERLGCTKS